MRVVYELEKGQGLKVSRLIVFSSYQRYPNMDKLGDHIDKVGGQETDNESPLEERFDPDVSAPHLHVLQKILEAHSENL